jgi:hypothetical protein
MARGLTALSRTLFAQFMGGFTSVDSVLRFIILTGLLGFILVNGSVFEVTYPQSSVELYAFPWWRFVIVLLVIAGASWCPYVGLATATAAFLYLNDMHILTKPQGLLTN